jgi:hypothetical protein
MISGITATAASELPMAFIISWQNLSLVLLPSAKFATATLTMPISPPFLVIRAATLLGKFELTWDWDDVEGGSFIGTREGVGVGSEFLEEMTIFFFNAPAPLDPVASATSEGPAAAGDGDGDEDDALFGAGFDGAGDLTAGGEAGAVALLPKKLNIPFGASLGAGTTDGADDVTAGFDGACFDRTGVFVGASFAAFSWAAFCACALAASSVAFSSAIAWMKTHTYTHTQKKKEKRYSVLKRGEICRQGNKRQKSIAISSQLSIV